MARPPSAPRTVLGYLIQQRNQTYEEVAAEFQRLPEGTPISARHLSRLARNEREGVSLTPATKRALLTLFGLPAEDLLRPWTDKSNINLPSEAVQQTQTLEHHQEADSPDPLLIKEVPSGSMRRRTVVRWGVAAAAGAGVARALTAYSFLGSTAQNPQPVTVCELADGTASTKRDYQACRYVAALSRLPALLDSIQLACTTANSDERSTIYRIAADAYQVTGSLLLKLGDNGLATLAADRSIDAASRCEDPIAIAASARIITHTVMSAGHPRRARDIATAAAERFEAAISAPSEDATSVYGALVLRGAIAAAIHEDRTGAATLLDEADQAARRLGHDDNAYWTAFGPTNVLLHRVNIAVLLGDAGMAIDLASRIDLSRVALPERQAALFLDLAQAYHQWGKHERACNALLQAERTAPEEIGNRRIVHQLVSDLSQRGPRFVQAKALELARRIGVEP